MPTRNIRTATIDDQHPTVSTIVLAFSADPVARWVFRNPQIFYDTFPKFVRAFAGNAFEHGSAYRTDEYEGAALWLPPDVHPDEERVGELLQQAVPEANQGEVFGFMEQMDIYHPKEPYWYLPLIGVDPTSQGQGIGSLLMEHALRPCDRDGLPAYLESSNPRNIPLYERHGFEIIGTIKTDSSPPMYPMLRKPR